MKAYISGPISANIEGTTLGERKLRFNLCEKWIKENRPDLEPVNPLKVVPECEGCGPDSQVFSGTKPVDGHAWECWMRYDLKALMDCQYIVLLPGWELSPGAALECEIAKTLGMAPYFADEDGRIVL